MAVWAVATQSRYGQQDPLRAKWTQQDGFRGPAPSTSRNQPSSLANKKFTRFSSVARKPLHQTDLLAGHGSPSKDCGQDMFRDPVLWGFNRPVGFESGATVETVIKLCHEGKVTHAVEALGVLVEADCCVSKYLFCTVLKQCVVKKDIVQGRRVHAFTVDRGYQADTFLCNQILRMYASQGRLQEAMDVFAVVDKPDAYTWSAIISAHVKQGQDKQAIQLYHRMRRSRVKPDSYVFVAALQACAKRSDLKTGQQVHGDVVSSGVEPNLFVWNCLVNMYAKCGSLEDAEKVFNRLDKKDVVTWNAMIAGYSQLGMGQEALRLYSAMQEDGIAAPGSVTFVCLLQACASVGSPALGSGKQLHAQIREQGHEADAFVASSLVNMYAKCGSLEDAQRVFYGLDQKDVVTWTAMIAGYSQYGMGQEALHLYGGMQEEGIAIPNSVTFVCLLQACASVGPPALEIGKLLHVQIRERGCEEELFIASSLVNMYAKCGSLLDAQRVFDGLGQKEVVTWTALIAGYSLQGLGQEALRLYSVMQEEGISVPDSVTFVCLLQACASLGTSALQMGKQLHAHVREQGYQDDMFVASTLVNMYAKCGSLEDATTLFDGLCQKDVVTWNAMIAGYSQQGMGQEALRLYVVMRDGGLAVPNPVTFVCLLQACASLGPPALEQGKQLHAEIREQGHQADVSVANSLVSMYSKCGSLEAARSVFDRLCEKDAVTWNALITGYSQQGMSQEALLLYNVLQHEGIAAPNCVTFVCLLQVCANVSALHLGRQLHMQIKEQELQADLFVAGSLIIMYGKSGSMVDAQQVFDELPSKDVVTWSALIAGYACHGESEVVFDLVRRMREDGMQPVSITFLSVLAVCSHAGLVDKGRAYFESMSTEYGIAPTEEHYTCMVDLLGRAGRLEEALTMVRSMPFLPSAVVWHTLLGACQKWSNVEVGRHAFDQAVKLDDKDAAAYVLMSNVYTGAKMWEQAQSMQARRTTILAQKQPGLSWWTDVDGLVHSFLAGDEKHPKRSRARLLSGTKKETYLPQLHSSPADISYHRKEGTCTFCSPSDKLPIAYSLDCSPSGTSLFRVN